MRIGIQIVTWHLTHFRVPLLVHSSMWPGCGINRSYLAVYIDCVAVSERLRAFTADSMFDYTFHWKSRILQAPHAAGINKIDFVFVDFPYLQGGLPRHCRKSSIYCQIKFRMNPLTLAITFKPEVIGLSYCTCIFLVTRPFTWYHNFCTCELDLDVWPI